jgi:hypothetical protein
MRTPDEIHSMIDYLEQKDRAHPDIAVLRWALKEDQRPVDVSMAAEREEHRSTVEQLNKMIQEQGRKILDQQVKLARFVQPPSRG